MALVLIAATTVLLFLPPLPMASAETHLWTRALGGGTVTVQDVAVDADGNVYSVGDFSGTVDFDPSSSGTANLTSTTNGLTDIFVSKLDSSGNYLWAKSAGGTSLDRAEGVAINASGVYVAGYFFGDVDFDPGADVDSLSAGGGTAAFVWKLDGGGNHQWVRGAGNYGSERAQDITLDGSGNVVTVGKFDGTVYFDRAAAGGALTSSGSDDAFVWKLDASGAFVWAAKMGGSATDTAASVDVRPSTNAVYVSGAFSGTADFNPSSSTETTLTSSGSEDAFVAMLDASGNYVWAQALGGTGVDYAAATAVDVASGNVHTVGYFDGTADFDPGTNTAALIAADGRDGFVSKLDANGDFVWARAFVGLNHQFAWGVDLDAAGNVFTIGELLYEVDLDPGSGEDIKTIANGAFVSKLDSSGAYMWGGAWGAHFGNAVTLDTTGNLYAAGAFYGTVDFDPSSASSTLIATGQAGYVTKLAPPESTPPTAGTVNDGLSGDIDTQLGLTELQANWSGFTDNVGVVRYEYAASTSSTCANSDVVAPTNVAGTATSTSATVSLTAGTTYYSCVRAVDEAGNRSLWAASDGVLATGDVTAPAAGVVNDGPAADIDYQGTSTALQANWSGFSDNVGIDHYEYAASTSSTCATPGVVAPTTVAGTATSTSAAVSLTAGTTYYSCVRAFDAAGNSSTWVASDGVGLASGTLAVTAAVKSQGWITVTFTPTANVAWLTPASQTTPFECDLGRRGAWVPCTSGQPIKSSAKSVLVRGVLDVWPYPVVQSTPAYTVTRPL